MSTREIYFKCLMLSELPKGFVGYIFKDKENVIQLGSCIPLEFSTKEDIVSENLKKMKEIESIEGFMFWHDSNEGEKFITDLINNFIKI